MIKFLRTQGRQYIPEELRLKIRVLRREIEDQLLNNKYFFAQTASNQGLYPYSISLSQEIKKTAHYENKVKNIRLACNKIGAVVIFPNEVLSFWRIVGEPNLNNGFHIGRNIIAGMLHENVGGGLCQLSGMIYYLSLLSSLDIIERYNHSIDIYTEETRFAPLGSDATVVYGYKDLRVRNCHKFPIKFNFDIKETHITACLMSEMEIMPRTIDFQKIETKQMIKVLTLDENQVTLAESVYQNP